MVGLRLLNIVMEQQYVSLYFYHIFYRWAPLHIRWPPAYSNSLSLIESIAVFYANDNA
jgi:hypothetical protein